MWKLCIDDDQANRTVVELVRDEYAIGRAEDNAVRLTERNISRHHAKLRREGDRWALVDTGSSNGCFVAGQRIQGKRLLESGEMIVLGDYQLRVVDGKSDRLDPPEPPAGVTSRQKGAAKVPGDRLIVLVGPTPLAEFPLSAGTKSIGRGEECDIRLDDTSVSRVHLSVQQLTDGVYRVEDAGSSNGLRVNGREVDAAVLTPDDLVELGDVELVFVPRGRSFDPRSYHPKAWSSARRVADGVRHNPRLMLSAAAGALLFALALFGLSSNGEEVAQPEKSPAAHALDEAEASMKAGRLELAHSTLEVIGAESNLRQSERFREVERRWADEQFERAQRAATNGEERQILERIARATGVDSARRKRASDLLSALTENDLVPTDLPRAARDAGAEPVVEEVAKPAKSSRPVRSAPQVVDLDGHPVLPADEPTGPDEHARDHRE